MGVTIINHDWEWLTSQLSMMMTGGWFIIEQASELHPLAVPGSLATYEDIKACEA